MTEATQQSIDLKAPEGYEEIECAIEFPPCVDWTHDEAVAGTVLKVQDVKVRKSGEDQMTRLLILDTEAGHIGVWESAGLTQLFNMLSPGDAVTIHRVGEKKIPGKPSPMRTFKAFRKPGRK